MVTVSEAVRNSKRNLERFVKSFAVELASEVIQETPVDTGNLRNSWYASQQPENRDIDGLSRNAVSEIAIEAVKFKPGDVFYILNGAAYARRLEYGFSGPDSLGRVYNQPPQPYVRPVANRAQQIADRVAKRFS